MAIECCITQRLMLKTTTYACQSLLCTMSRKLHRLLLLLLASHCCSAHLTTSVVTVIAASPKSTPCSELDPVTNRMQWAQQCAMAPSNIMPSPNTPAARTTCSGSGCSTLETSVRSSKSSQSVESSPKSSPTRTDSKAKTGPKSTLRSTQAHTSRKPPASTTTQSTPSSSTAPSNDQHSSTPSIGSIAGLVIGILLALLLGWFLWHKKDTWSVHLPCSCFHDEYPDSDEPYWRDGGRYESSYSYQDPTARGFSRKFSFESGDNVDESPTAPYDVRNIGNGARGVTDYGYGRSYAVMNPDPPSASTVTAQSRGDGVQAYARPEPERHTEGEGQAEHSEDDDDDAESQTSDSDSSESARDSAQSSSDNISDSSSSYSTDDVNEEENEAASQHTASSIIDMYRDRRKPRRAEADALHLTPSSAAFSGAETSDGLPATPSPLLHPPPAVYMPYTPRVESASYRPGEEFEPARANWKREAPERSKFGGSPLDSG